MDIYLDDGWDKLPILITDKVKFIRVKSDLYSAVIFKYNEKSVWVLTKTLLGWSLFGIDENLY